MGIELEQFLAVPIRMFVAGDNAKSDAVRATLAGELATHFVVDESLAEFL